jgi:hypothetical protein
MKKIKYSIFILIIFASLFFLLGPEMVPENIQPQEILNLATDNDIIIIFNSGGWGDTPLEKAKDFAPIIEGLEETLNGWGYKSVVVPYTRTKDGLLGRITGAKDFFESFKSSSGILAKDLEFLAENLPDKKIIVTGLSNGATLVAKTYEKISEETKNSVYAITVGAPFWAGDFKSGNILQLDNRGKDSLARGDAKSLALTLIKAPFKWISSKFNGQNLTFSQILHAPGHDYFWSSSEVSSEIVTFLENKLH